MKYICLQENNYDCGLACIKMMLAHYHKNRKFIYLDKEIINQRYSLLQLKNYALKYNLKTEGVEFSDKEMLFDNPDSMCQVLINDNRHFVIFERKKDKYVYIIDPKIGRVKLKIDHFLSIFTGYSLIKTEVSDYKLKIKYYDKTNINYGLVYTCFLTLDFVLLILLSYLGDNSNFIFHNLIIIFLLTISILVKIILINSHQNYIDNKIKNIIENHKLSHSTKRGLLGYKVTNIKYIYGSINSAFVSIFVSFILILNGFYNILLIPLIVLIIYIFSKIKRINHDTNNYLLSIDEEYFLNSNNKQSYTNLLKSSKRVLKYNVFSMIFYQIGIILLITLLNNILNINSFEFIVFNTMYYFILISRIKFLFNESYKLRLEYVKYWGIFNYLSENKSKIQENQ